MATVKSNGIVLHTRAVGATTILLDSQANISLFRDDHLLNNVRESEVKITISGINTNDASLTSDQVGDFRDLGTVFYHPQAAANILSFSDMSKNNTATYSQLSNSFSLTTPAGSVYKFEQNNGLYECDVTTNDSHMALVTVADQERMYTSRQVKSAQQARKLIRSLGYPSPRVVVDMINAGTLTNCPVTPQDISRAYSIYGPDASVIRGKTTIRPSIPYKEQTLERVVQQEQTLHTDVMFVNKHAFLTSVSSPLALTTCSDLGRGVGGRSKAPIRKALFEQLSAYTAQGYKVTTLLTDGEGAIASLTSELQGRGVAVL
jgi:hypothetical protein